MRNPYATASAREVDDVRVDRTFVFGDSYSVPSHAGVPSWSTRLKGQGRTRAVDNFAVEGATAGDTTGRSFADQVNRFTGQGRRPDGDDLTVVYFGYNDVNLDLDRDAAFADYRAAADRLAARGATAGDQRMFVTTLTDWGRSPGAPASDRAAVLDWNRRVAAYANARRNVVAVDLFSVFERIFENPGTFGFDDVTTVDPANAASTSLFVDRFHFGRRGQDIIARVYDYYLTRGWDAANSLRAGQAAMAALGRALDQGRVLSLAATPDGDAALRLRTLGTQVAADEPVEGTPDTSMRAALAADERRPDGLALDLDLGPDWRLALSLAEHRGRAGFETERARGESTVDTRSLGLSLEKRAGDWRASTRMVVAADDLLLRRSDLDLHQESRARTGGEVVQLGQRLDRPIRAMETWWTPWLDLTFERRAIDAYTIDNPYFGPVHHDSLATTDVVAGLGLSAAVDPIVLGTLTIHPTGAVGYTRSLVRDDAKQGITESGSTLGRQMQVIERDSIEALDLMLGLRVVDGDALDLATSWVFRADRARGPAHDLHLVLRYRF